MTHYNGHGETGNGAFTTGAGGVAARLARFARREDGAATIMSLFFFMGIIMLAGLGIDTMRQEMERARLQATLDSAVLAGAGAPQGTQKKEIKDIVIDYFDKHGMAAYLNDIDIDGEGEDDIRTSLNATRVFASADKSIDTHLMRLAGVETLSASGAAEAEVRTPKLEVSLVLDVSGSMSGRKLRSLKTAAKDFVSTLLSSSEAGNTVISVIPFSWSVTPPQTVFDTLAVDETHAYSTCLKFRDQDFRHASLTSGASALSNGVPVNQMIFTSVYGGFKNLNTSWRSCYTDDYMKFLPYSMSESDLHAKIDALQADGNTSGHIGMNWGAALLDPTFRKVSAELINTGEVDAELSHVPADYDEPETLKVVVMMGDGANTTSYFFDKSPPEYRGTHSDLLRITYKEMEFDYGFARYNVHKKRFDDDYEEYCDSTYFECLYNAAGEEVSSHYLPWSRGNWYYDLENRDWIHGSELESIRSSEGFISEEQLTWEEAWGLMSPDFYSDITDDSGAWNDYVYSERVNGGAKDTHMDRVCGATKAEDVVVYTIGFEVPSSGRAERALSDCASSRNHYYRASSTDISAAFSSIASNVKNLRLTQ